MGKSLKAATTRLRQAMSVLPRGSAAGWVGAIGLLFLLISTLLMGTAEVALQYWYLMSVPIVLAGFRFGRVGALAASVLSLLVVLAVFRTAGHSFQQMTGYLGTLMDASTSPGEASRLAAQLADLRANDPIVVYQRALGGLLLVIIGGILLGTAVDNRNRAYLFLEQVIQRLGRYFSPQLIAHITSDAAASSFAGATARREITLLFADLRDFTSHSDRMEPEEVVAILNEYLKAMTEEIFHQDGTLDKYIGDGIMAFFGDPVWHPDHAARGFRAALAMHRRMRQLHASWEDRGWPAIGMGIGVTTGLATVGNVGSPTRMDYTAIGSTVNVAARLSSEARSGQTLTTRRTYRRVEHLFTAVGQEPTMVKGFAEPFDIVDVTGERMAVHEMRDRANERLERIVATLVDDDAYRAFLIGRPDEAASVLALTDEERRLGRQVAVLCGYPLFQGLPASEIAALVGVASVEQFNPWSVVVHEGLVEDKFYVILSGDAAVTVTREGEPERHLASLGCGEHFGEIGLLQNVPRTATVRVTSPSHLIVVDREAFFAVLDRAPGLRGRIEAAAQARTGAGPTTSVDGRWGLGEPSREGAGGG